MDKAQAMHLDAHLPQNWWEFAVDCTTHVYNCTSIQHHDWKTPFENLKHTNPDVTHLHVFRCGMYVFLPEEVHVNKLNPKSELMTFLGYPQGTKGYLFMRGPNNVLFMAVQALFNETLFPKCPDMHCPRYIPVVPVNAQDEYNIPPEDNENGNDGGAPLGQHHLGDMCLIRHLCLDHCLEIKAKARTLILWCQKHQPLQELLLRSWSLMISMSLRHLPQEPLVVLQTPHMDSSILI